MVATPCTIEGCERSPQHAKGWCRAHYIRWRRYGDPLGGKVRYEECTVEGCSAKPYSRGWCNKHYERWRVHGDPLGGRPPRPEACLAGDCQRPIHIKGYCVPHYYRIQHYGDPHGGSPVKPFQSRERRWAKAPEYCSIEGCNRPPAARGWCTTHYARWRAHGNPLMLKTRTNYEDARYVNNQGYVVLKRWKDGGQVTVLEHRQVMEGVLGRKLYPFENVHHKNGIKTDNSPENLEVWVKAQPCGQRLEDQIEFWAKNYPSELKAALKLEMAGI